MKNFLLPLIFSFFLFGKAQSQSILTFYTSMGNFEVQLYDTLKPITAGNFRTLVEDEFYDGVIFHRVISNFVIQGGDPTGTGSGGPGYSIQDEFDSSLSNLEKTLSMANSGPNTGGSQFFINTKNNTFLDFDKAPLTSAHPVFGVVINGWDTVEMIEAVAVNANDRPLVNVVMDSVRVKQYPLAIIEPSHQKVKLEIFPNPTKSDVFIKLNYAENSTYSIMVYDVAGKQVVLQNNFSESLFTINASNLKSGLYLVKTLGDKTGLTVSKLLVK